MAVSKLWLASNSPRRRELLALTGLEFVIRPTRLDETPLGGESPSTYVRRLAEEKSRAAGQSASPGVLVLGADTTVADGDDILGKPEGADEAREMLRRLRNKIHRVFTAVSLYDPGSGAQVSEVCATQVPMRDYTDEEIEAYVASGDPLDKAGAYAIQHAQFKPVPALSGCYASVMGLPLCHLARALRVFNVEPQGDLPAACQRALHYDCPIYQAVQRGEQIG